VVVIVLSFVVVVVIIMPQVYYRISACQEKKSENRTIPTNTIHYPANAIQANTLSHMLNKRSRITMVSNQSANRILHLNRHLCFLFVSVILQYSIGMSTKKNHSKSIGESFFAHFFGTVFAYHLSPLEGGFSVFPPMGGSTPKTRRWSKNNKHHHI
jgi:uncharacterized membrane protein